MDSRLVAAQDSVLSRVSQMCSKFGLNNVMAQLYVVLYFSNKPLCLDDMVERLKISKGSASINIRALERYGVVRQVWVKGSRKDYYEAETDIAKVVIERVSSMAKTRLAEVDKMITISSAAMEGVRAEGGEDEESVRVFNERLGQLKSFYAQVKGMFDFFEMNMAGNGAAADRKEEGAPESVTV